MNQPNSRNNNSANGSSNRNPAAPLPSLHQPRIDTGTSAPVANAPWTLAKDFTDARSGVTVRVNSRTLPPRFTGAIPLTEYSWELIRLSPGARGISRFFALTFLSKLGQPVSVDRPFDGAAFLNLLEQAESWARGMRQERENLILEQKIEKEEKQAAYGRQESRPGLKSLSKLDGQRR